MRDPVFCVKRVLGP
jgi:uncharacterized protein YbjT (DUF2867 family)